MTKTAAFWDNVAPSYISNPIKNVENYEHKLALTQKYLTTDMDVLEIGCGSGNTGRLHAPFVRHYTATDLSPEMIRIGREQEPLPDNMEMRVMDCDADPMPAESYDAVLAMSLLHLVPDPKATVAKIAGALRPGGIFVSSTGAIGHMWPLKLVLPLLKAIGKAPHINFFRPSHVRALMRDAGLEIVEDWHPKKDAAIFLIARKPI